MQYGRMKGLEKPVSRLLMGTMMLNTHKQEESDALLDSVFALGVNAFDTGLVYPNGSEAALGHWIAERGLRDKVAVFTKGAHPSAFRKRVTPYDILSDFHESLARLGMTRVDGYLLHRDDPSVPVASIVDTLNRLRDEGKVSLFGGSNWTYERLYEANEYAARFGMEGFSLSSPNYSLAEQVEDPWGGGCVTISGPQNAEARAFYRQTQIPVLAYSSLCRGFLSGLVKADQPEKASSVLDANALKGYAHPRNFARLKRCEELAARRNVTVPQIATAWLFHQPENVYAIVGVTDGAQMAQNAFALELSLTDDELRYLNLEDA